MTEAHRTPLAREQSRLARRPSARERALLEAFPAKELPHLMVRRVLGVGGTATVYEAFHARLGLNVAVKVLSVRGDVAEEARTRMLREARLYATLADARIPRVYDVNVLPDGRAYVVLEWRSGTPLARMIGDGRALSPELALHVARELLEPLAYLHGAGIIHRDVTPANVLIDSSTTPPMVCLIDLGIAKSQSLGEGDAVNVTRQGTLLGTPQYMSPERLIDGEADERSDVYAVGVLLYEMLTGVSAFDGNTPAEIVAAVLRDAPKDLRARLPNLSPRVVHAAERAMAREPADRFASAQEMLTALDEGSGVLRRIELATESGADEPVELPVDPQRSGKLMVVAASVLGLVLFGLWYRDERTHSPANVTAEPANVQPPREQVAPAAALVPQPAAAMPELLAPEKAQPAANIVSAVEPEEEPPERSETHASRRAHRSHVRSREREIEYVPARREVEYVPARDYGRGSTSYVAPEAPAPQTPRAVPENPYEKIPENPYQ